MEKTGGKGKNIKQVKQNPKPDQERFKLDFTDLARPAKQLLSVIADMRSEIEDRRNEQNSPTLKYTVKCSKIDLCAVLGYEKLEKSSEDKLTKINSQATVVFPAQENNVIMTISVNGIYPSNMGWAGYGNGQKQCYHIVVNNQPYTFIDINYPDNPSFNPTLTDMLGILVAEQIRFNTLEIYLKVFPNAYELSTKDLYYYLFKSFKVSIYNGWGNPWEKDHDDKLKKMAEYFELNWRKETFLQEKSLLEEKELDERLKEIQQKFYKELLAKEKALVEEKERLDKLNQQLKKKKLIIAQGKKPVVEEQIEDYREFRQVKAINDEQKVVVVVVEKVVKQKKQLK